MAARGWITGVFLALMIVAVHHGWYLTLAAALVAIIAARERATRIGLGVLGMLLICGVPWIIAPCLAGAVWVVWWVRSSPVKVSALRPRWRSGTILLILCCGAISGVLAAQVSLVQYRDNPIQIDTVQPSPVALWLGIVVLSLANAFGEEVLWREMLAREIRGLRAVSAALLMFVSFGLAHWYGLPAGLIGAVLSGVCSVALFWLRSKHGPFASMLAHFVTDTVLFAGMAPALLFTGWYSGT